MDLITPNPAEPTSSGEVAPVEGPPPMGRDLRDALCPPLPPERRAALAARVLSDYHAALIDRAEWEQRLVEWDNAYYNRVPTKTFPWPGAANFHVPLTMMGIETFKPRLVEAVLGQIPPLHLVATRGADEARKDVVESFLNWQVLSELQLEPVVNQSAHLFLHPGLVAAKTYWLVERQWQKMVREFPIETPLEQILTTLFGAEPVREVTAEGEASWSGWLPGTVTGGGPRQVKLTIRPTDDPQLPVLQVLVEREEVTERPQVDLIAPEDLIMPARGGHEVAQLPWIIHRMWMREDDLRRKARLGRFDPHAVETLLTSGTPKGDQPPTDSGTYRQSQDAVEGISGTGPSSVRREEWEILECYRRTDIDGDGFEEEVILWGSPDLPNDILGWDYLSNVYAHGRRPLRLGRYFPIPFRTYGLPFAEVVKGIQDEINTIHNQRVDYATIQNLPFGFKRPSSSIPNTLSQIRPGELVDVDNPQQDVVFPRWQGSPAWGQQEEAVLMQYFERLSGLTDMVLGRQPNRVGATRTAAGTQTLLSEAGLRFRSAVTAFQRFWTGIFEDILALDQEYLSPNKEFRVTGRRPTTITLKDRSELGGHFDLRLASTTETMNRQRSREDAMMVLQALQNPIPLTGGLVGKKGIRRAYEDFLKAFGKDPTFYLEDSAPILSPVEELMKFQRGEYVSPVQGENIQAHMTAHMAALQDPLVPPATKQLLQRHIQETYQIAQTMMMAQAMQQRPGGPPGRTPSPGGPPVGPQAVNAQTGAQPQAGMPPGPPNGGGPPG